VRTASEILFYENGRLSRHELFYSAAKARRAFERAQVKDALGYTIVESEDASASRVL
jgi:hypothetical protein